MENKNLRSQNLIFSQKPSIKSDIRSPGNYNFDIKNKNNPYKSKNNSTNKTLILSDNKFQNAIITNKSTSKDIVKRINIKDGKIKSSDTPKLIDYLGKSIKEKPKQNILRNFSHENPIKETVKNQIDNRKDKSKNIINKYYNFYLDDFVKSANITNDNIQSMSSTKFNKKFFSREKIGKICESISSRSESFDEEKQKNEETKLKKEVIKININNNNYFSNSTLNQEENKNEINFCSVENKLNEFVNTPKNNCEKINWDPSNNLNQIYQDHNFLKDKIIPNCISKVMVNRQREFNKINSNNNNNNNKTTILDQEKEEIEVSKKYPSSTHNNNPSYCKSKKIIFESDKNEFKNYYLATNTVDTQLKLLTDNNFQNMDYSDLEYIPLSRKQKKSMVEEINHSSIQRMGRYSVLLDKLKNQLTNINELLLSKEEEEQILKLNGINANRKYTDIVNVESNLLNKLNTISDFLTDKMVLIENNKNEQYNSKIHLHEKDDINKFNLTRMLNKENDINDYISSTSFYRQISKEKFKFHDEKILTLDSLEIEDKNKNTKNNYEKLLLNDFFNFENEMEKSKNSKNNWYENDIFTNIDVLNESLENIEKKINNLEKIINKAELQPKENKIIKENDINFFVFNSRLFKNDSSQKTKDGIIFNNYPIYYDKNTRNNNILIKNNFNSFDTPIKRENNLPESNYNNSAINLNFSNLNNDDLDKTKKVHHFSNYNRKVNANKESPIIINDQIRVFYDNHDESTLYSNMHNHFSKPEIFPYSEFKKNLKTNLDSLYESYNNMDIPKPSNNTIKQNNQGNAKISLINRNSIKKFEKLDNSLNCFSEREIDEKIQEIKIPNSILLSNNLSKLHEKDNSNNRKNYKNNQNKNCDRKKRNKFSYDLNIDSKILKEFHNRDINENDNFCIEKYKNSFFSYKK